MGFEQMEQHSNGTGSSNIIFLLVPEAALNLRLPLTREGLKTEEAKMYLLSVTP